MVGFNFIDGLASSNNAFFVVRLKPYEERTDPSESVNAIIAKLRRNLAAVQGAIVFPFNLPPIIGLGSTGGFQYVLEALQGQSPADLAATLRGLVVAANQQPELAGVFSTYAADTPQIYLDIDRDKAQVLGIQISDIFTALQATLGGFYVNDFNLFGRTWQVNVQAETPFRKSVDDIYRIYVRNAQGAMVPMRALAQARLVQGPQAIVRYNGHARRRHQRRAGTGLQLRRRARRDGANLGKHPAGRLRLSNGRARPIRRTRRAARPRSCSASPSCSPISSSSRSTKAGTSRSRC